MKKGFVAEVAIVALTLASTLIVFNTLNPVIEEGKTTQSITDAKQVLKTIDAVLNQLVFEAQGAKRSMNVNLQQGKFVFSGRDDRIKVRLDSSVLKIGSRVEEENIIIQGGGTLDAYESDILGDGQIDLVLENEAVLLAIKKLGTASNQTFINTSSIITLVANKRQGVNLTYPRSGIFISDILNSSYGIGYTELSIGNTQSSSIVLHMSSYANITYDAIFSMSAASDFFEVEVKNVRRT